MPRIATVRPLSQSTVLRLPFALGQPNPYLMYRVIRPLQSRIPLQRIVFAFHDGAGCPLPRHIATNSRPCPSRKRMLRVASGIERCALQPTPSLSHSNMLRPSYLPLTLPYLSPSSPSCSQMERFTCTHSSSTFHLSLARNRV